MSRFTNLETAKHRWLNWLSFLLGEFLGGAVSHHFRVKSASLANDGSKRLVLVQNFAIVVSIFVSLNILLALIRVQLIPNTVHVSERFRSFAVVKAGFAGWCWALYSMFGHVSELRFLNCTVTVHIHERLDLSRGRGPELLIILSGVNIGISDGGRSELSEAFVGFLAGLNRHIANPTNL
jgi:hypothetical protein